jgi:hypothetical protein
VGSVAEVFDATGQLVFKSQIRSLQSQINIPGLASGLYELRIISNGYRLFKKLVKI